jgi:N-carbamoyl-L-amino-acid hydrolase
MPALSKDASERRLGAVLQQLSSHSQARRRRGSPPPPLPAAPAAADSAAEAQWQAALDLAVRERAATLAADLFDELREGTHDGIGITRASYGEGEDFAHSLLGATAASVEGLEVEVDAAGNTFMTLPGADRQLPAVVVGSHLDSVARGGNFDGAAGVVAGVVALCALRDAGIVPARDVRVMGIRGEEGEWFGVPFIGARSALGTLPLSDLDEARRVDSDMPLRHHMLESGCDLRAIEAGRGVSLPPAQQHAFIELHIEQGPQLEQKSLPLGVVTGIRGNTRLLGARCVGEYSHCGGVPRAQRHDAVVAAAELVAALDAIWDECEEANRDFAYTVGKFYTDEEHHQMSKIAGEVSFSLDMRSLDAHTLVEMEERVRLLSFFLVSFRVPSLS